MRFKSYEEETPEEQRKYALWSKAKSNGSWIYDGQVSERHARICEDVWQRTGVEYRIIDLESLPSAPWS